MSSARAPVAALRAGLGLASALLVIGNAVNAQALTLEADPPVPASVNQPVQFAAAVSETVGDVTFDWNFGDGTEVTGQSSQATHTYALPGHYPVIVKATDESSFRSQGLIVTVHLPLPATPPSSSSPLALDPDRARVWCVNPDNDTLSAFDVSTRERLFEVPTESHPRTLARGPDDTFWVVNQDSHSLTLHAAIDGSLIDSLPLDYASRPFGIVIHGTTAYVTLEGLGGVLQIDTTTREVTGRAELVPMPRGLSVSADGETLFIARFISPDSGGEVYRVDTRDMTLADTLDLAIDDHPDAESDGRGLPNYLASAVLSPDGQSIWVPSKKDNIERGAARDGLALNHENAVRAIVSRIDTTSGLEDADFRVDFNDRDSPSAVAFTPLGDTAFVSLQGSNRLEIVDAYSGAILGGILDAGRAPQGLLVFENVLIAHEYLSRDLAFFDVSTVLAGTDYYATLLGRTPSVASEALSPEVLRGKQIFYDSSDTRMSQDGYISCASCHIDGFEDGRVWDFTDRGEGFRNTTSLLGRRGTGHGPVHWTANFDEIQDFEHDMRNAFGGTGFLTDDEFNEGTRNTTLGDPKAGLDEELDALAAYVASLDRIHPSPYRNQDGTLTAAGVRGNELFAELDCAGCHTGEDFTDSEDGVRHDVGTIEPTSGQRLGAELDGFDTPTLLGIWETAPYLHDGSAETLHDVFLRLGAELHAERELSEPELDDLVSYLLQIDGLPDVGSTAEPTLAAGGMPGSGGEAGSAGHVGETVDAMDGGDALGGQSATAPPPGAGRTSSGCGLGSRARNRNVSGVFLSLVGLSLLRRRKPRAA